MRHLMQDLIIDYRHGDKSCYSQIKALWKNRHTVKFDKYGWPMLPEFQSPDVGAVANLDALRELCRVKVL